MADFCGVNPQVSSRPRGVVLSLARVSQRLAERALARDFGGSARPNASFVPLAR